MVTHPYWINAQLAIVPRPRGSDWLDDEMAALREAGIDFVVSMLEEDEARDLGLKDEKVAAERAGLLFANFAIQDRNVPLDKELFESFLANLEGHLDRGKRVGIHCRACIGRASLATASLLIRSGVPPESAWLQISRSRGCIVPDTIEQREWVERYIRSKT